MKKVLVSIFCMLALNSVMAQTDTIDLNPIKQDISVLQSNQTLLKKEVSALTNKNRRNESQIKSLETLNQNLCSKLDSLRNEFNKVVDNQKADKTELSTKIGQTNEKVQATEDILSSRTLWGVVGIVILLISIIATVFAFLKKFKTGSTSIDDIRKAQSSMEQAQENIRKAQEKMQEETIQLDNKLIEVLSKQSVSAPTTKDGEVDHSLTLKVADEIVKIEMNLSRMDENIKGYKQLSRGVQRIKDNFKANDYEIVDMLGKDYQPGMKVIATFIPDEKLEPGKQIITRIIKPQVNYKQVMIQAAQIEVSQGE